MTTDWIPVTPENCANLPGPFYHGTKARLSVGDRLVTGFETHFEQGSGRALRHVYFSSLLEPAIWGAELAVALSGTSASEERGYVYLVKPTGPFEDDPNLTNKRFPGNPTRSYRTTEPLEVVGIVEDWEGHPPEMVQAMVSSLQDLQRKGLHVIED